MPRTRRSPGDHSRAPSKSVSATATIVPLYRQVSADELRHMLYASVARNRLGELRLAADRLATGRPVDPAWIRVQLLDLVDLLEAGDVG